MSKRRNPSKEKRRKERLRKEKHERQRGKKSEDELADILPLHPSGAPDSAGHQGGSRVDPVHSMDSERMSRSIRRHMDSLDVDSIEEAQVEMNKFIGRNIDDILPGDRDDPAYQAQELAYQAMEASDPLARAKLATQALKIDPRCVDALCLRTSLMEPNPRDAVAGIMKAMEIGAETLGEEFFRENRGHFWSMVETRPYMRARQALAVLLWEAGRRIEAVEHCEALLELNPHDNQGIRQELLPRYLAVGELARAEKLFSHYPDEISAVFPWCRLLGHLIESDDKRARKALKRARKCNPHVEDILTGAIEPPDVLPDHYQLGSVEEAFAIGADIWEAWYHHPEARIWLLDQKQGKGKRRRPEPPGPDIMEMTIERIAGQFPEFLEWPGSWTGDEDYLKLAQEIWVLMIPFVNSLLEHGYKRTTMDRHLSGLWYLGSEIVGTASIGKRRKNDAVDLLLDAIDERGGPDCRRITSRTAEDAYHTTCRKFFHFLIKG